MPGLRGEMCGHDRAEHAATGCAQCLQEAAGQQPVAKVCGRVARASRAGPAKQVWAERLAYTRSWLTWTYRMTLAGGAVALGDLLWLPEDGAEAARAVAITAALLATILADAPGTKAFAILLLPFEFAYWVGFALPLGPPLGIARTVLLFL